MTNQADVQGQWHVVPIISQHQEGLVHLTNQPDADKVGFFFMNTNGHVAYEVPEGSAAGLARQLNAAAQTVAELKAQEQITIDMAIQALNPLYVKAHDDIEAENGRLLEALADARSERNAYIASYNDACVARDAATADLGQAQALLRTSMAETASATAALEEAERALVEVVPIIRKLSGADVTETYLDARDWGDGWLEANAELLAHIAALKEGV